MSNGNKVPALCYICKAGWKWAPTPGEGDGGVMNIIVPNSSKCVQ